MSKQLVDRTTQQKSRSRTRSVSTQPYPLSPTRRRTSMSRSNAQSSAQGGRASSPPPTPSTPAAVREMRQEAKNLVEAPTTQPSQRDEEEEEEELAKVLAGSEWAPSEVSLFTKMRRRGKEPLFPDNWKLDFATFPDVLYAPIGEQSFLGALNVNMEFRGTQAFQQLVNVGGLVRDRIEVNPTNAVEPLIFNAIQKYITWIEKDAKRSLSSVLTVAYNRDRRGTSTTASDKVEKRMLTLATGLHQRNQQRTQARLNARGGKAAEERKPAVVVYGITVFNCVAALSTLNSEKLDGDVKNIVVLDWSDRGLDLWNAIGIALLIVTARDDILDSDEEAMLQVKEHPDEDA